MGLKKKIFGFVAAAALTLSMVSGVGAVPGNAVLTPGQCEAGNAVNSGAANFGTWKYNGSTGYELQGTYGVANSHHFNVNVAKVATPGGKCTVGIAVSDLSNGTHIIPSGNFSGIVPGQEVAMPISVQQGFGTVGYKVNLDSVPGEISTGGYTGTVTVSVSSGS